MIELFMESIDTIYYPRYAEDMLLDNPDRFVFEFSEFLSIYGSGLTS